MAYCTRTDIEKQIPKAQVTQLTKDSGDVLAEQEANTIARVADAIASADAIVNGFLSTRDLVLPLNPVPVIIKTLSIDLAIWALHNRRTSLELPKPIQQRYDNAMKLLDRIQSGKLGWGAQEADPNAPAEFRTDKATTDKLFPKSVLDKF